MQNVTLPERNGLNVIWFISLRLQLQADEVRMQDWEEAEKAYGEASD